MANLEQSTLYSNNAKIPHRATVEHNTTKDNIKDNAKDNAKDNTKDKKDNSRWWYMDIIDDKGQIVKTNRGDTWTS